MTKAKKRPSGSASLRARGLQAVLVGFEPAEKEAVESAAKELGQSVFQFVRHAAKEKAKKILPKNA